MVSFHFQLVQELDLNFGHGTVGRFRQSWMDIVPLICRAARAQALNSKALKGLLDHPRFKDISKEFGTLMHTFNLFPLMNNIVKLYHILLRSFRVAV